MATYYLETSALVKRYALERGSAWVERLCDQAAGHVILIAQVTQTETVAALCRKARVGAIGPAERDNAIALFRRHVRRRYALERVTNAAYIRAGDLCCIYNLRAYDSIQLACALALRDRVTAQGHTPVFPSAESNLLGFASQEGMATDNPDNHT